MLHSVTSVIVLLGSDSDDDREVKPLEQNGKSDFWVAARNGDLPRIKFLVEVAMPVQCTARGS